ncbi:MAG: DUF2256 domain-containing protein [Flavobacteriales bacterium]|nr:DUF2256 domain-containing protein [Flavobacteriales bacterium]
MPRHRPSSERPSRRCAVCGLPFQWRKKWEKVWDEVNYCSERCRRNRNHVPHTAYA